MADTHPDPEPQPGPDITRRPTPHQAEMALQLLVSYHDDRDQLLDAAEQTLLNYFDCTRCS